MTADSSQGHFTFLMHQQCLKYLFVFFSVKKLIVIKGIIVQHRCTEKFGESMHRAASNLNEYGNEI